MAKSRSELQQERGQLLERIAHQRSTLAREITPLLEAEQAGARIRVLVQAAVRSLQEKPLPAVAVVVALLVWKPRRAWRWARRGLWWWRKWLAVRDLGGLYPF